MQNQKTVGYQSIIRFLMSFAETEQIYPYNRYNYSVIYKKTVLFLHILFLKIAYHNILLMF